MAQMFPDRLPSRSSAGEKALFAVLQQLPDDYLVYYEPVVGDRYPDFVVIAPDLGVLVIEVKGWRPGDIHGADANDIRTKYLNEPIQVVRHPVRQARDYMARLMDNCRRTRVAQALLTHAGGPHEGRFVFPFGHFAVLSNITGDQLKNHTLGDLTPVFPPDRTVTRDVLQSWDDLPGAEIRTRLARFFNPAWEFPRLDEQRVNALRSIIHPEIGVGVSEDSLAVLDLKQEGHVRSNLEGHRVILGVAGSGKTVLLTARAKLLAERRPEPRILVLCFNVMLATRLAANLAHHANVQVRHFDGWSKHNGVTRRSHPEVEDSASLGGRLKAYLDAGKGDARQFDAVLIDEAQDFDPSWFECVLAAMKDPDDGNLLVVGDANQGIISTRKFQWSHVGVKAVGRTFRGNKLDLDRNYRNTREIAELAACFAQDPAGEGDEDDGFGIVPLDPAKSVRSLGVRPVIIRAKSREAECEAVVALVRRLVGHDGAAEPRVGRALRPEEVGILYPSHRGVKPLVQGLLERLSEFTQVVWLSDSDRSGGDNRKRVGEPGVKVQTIHSAKGLQYPAVIVLWADHLPWQGQDPAEAAKLMYVALTRPEDFLFVTRSRPSDFVRRIEASGKAELVDA